MFLSDILYNIINGTMFMLAYKSVDGKMTIHIVTYDDIVVLMQEAVRLYVLVKVVY